MKIIDLRCNACASPIQVDDPRPSFSWRLVSEERDAVQRSFRLEVFRTVGDGRLPVWDTARVRTGETLQILYNGDALLPDERYEWAVTVWDSEDETPACRAESWFETGLMQAWQAEWIGFDELEPGEAPFDPSVPFYCADDFSEGRNRYYLPPAPYLRSEFRAEAGLKRAKLFVSAFGLAEVSINGENVTADRFVPGLSNYKAAVYSRAYDVTPLIRSGENALGVILADGWYAGYIGLRNREWFGKYPRVMLELVLTGADGKKTRVLSGGGWRAAYGALRESDIFEGECQDAAREPEGWKQPGFDDGGWSHAAVGAEHPMQPSAHPGVPVVEQREFSPARLDRPDADRCLVDLGEDISGTLILTLRAPRGTRVTIRHAELRRPDGSLLLEGNRSARAQDAYVCAGTGTEVFKPKFTYHGFRYADITGLTGAELLDVKAVVLGSEAPEQTAFETSSETVNAVFDMIRRTALSNRFEVPTDCNARDERLGWGMEGNFFTAASACLGNQEAFIRKWTRDIWSGQRDDGALEPIAPPLMMKDVEQFVGDLQSNHGVHMVYTLYRQYGDVQTVRELYPRMERYFDFLDRNSDRCIRYATSGDWLGIWESTDRTDTLHGYGDCSPTIIGTAHYAIAARMMAEMAGAIGRTDGAEKYAALGRRIRRSFILNYIQRDGTLRLGRQGDYVMALAAGFIPEKYRAGALGKLCRMLDADGRVFWRGGTPTSPFFLPLLKQSRREDLANAFLASTSYPSLGYMRAMGATTVWERWDGIREDGTLHPQQMNAMNHIGLTVFSEYMLTGLAGIRPLAPGYRVIGIDPGPSREIRAARAALFSKPGEIRVDWRRGDGTFRLDCVIPANTRAEFSLPCLPDVLPSFGGAEPADVRWENGRCLFRTGSGSYQFETAVEK